MKSFWQWIPAFLLTFSFSLSGGTPTVQAHAPGSDPDSPATRSRTVWKIAHRGASAHAPEQTIPAFDLALRMNADFIELDVKMTKDGHLVAIHDETVDRTTNGSGPVRDYTLKELRKLDAGSWFGNKHPRKMKPEYRGAKIPTLEEIFRHYGRKIGYCIETKEPERYPGLEEKLIRTLHRYDLLPREGQTDRVIIHSFSEKSLKKIHRLQPNLPSVQLIHFKEARVIPDRRLQAIQQYADGIGFSHWHLHPNDVHRAHRHGLRIHPYTINRKRDMARLLDWGVDAICTDYPDRLDQVIHKRSHHPRERENGSSS